MAAFLKLIRFPNLVMIALTQFLVYYYWILPFTKHYIGIEKFIFVILATVLIAAGGNIINDIFDVKTDQINKPQKVFIGTFISRKNAFLLYYLCTFVGIGLGSFVGFAIDTWWISLLFLGIAVLLFWYSSHLKSIPLLGNIVISALVASSLLILILFKIECAAVRHKHIHLFYKVSLIAICIYAMFAFLMNLMRELVKDIEDINGDYNAGISTLPIVLGRNRVNKIVAFLAGMTIVFTLYVINEYLQGKTVTTIYSLLTVLLPLLYCIIKIWQADSKREYKMISLLLKIIMLFGILSIIIMNYFDPLDSIKIIPLN